MISKRFFLLSIFAFGLITCHLRLLSQTTFQKTYGTELDEYGASSIELPDGNILMLAQAAFTNLDSSLSTDDDVILMIVNSFGNIQSSLRYSLPGDQEAVCIIKTHDGGFLIAGNDFGGTNQRNFILKLNNEFSIVWSKMISSSDRVRFHMLKEDSQGNIYYGADRFFGTYPDILLIKIDSFGNELWKRTWGKGNNDHVYDIQFGNDGNIYVATSFWFPSAEFVMFCLNKDGQSLWEKSLFQDVNYYPRSFIDIGNGESILVGHTHNTNHSFAIRFDASLNPVWSKLITTSAAHFTAESGVYKNGNIYVIGDYLANEGDIVVLSLSISGNFNWMKGYGGDSKDMTTILSMGAIRALEDGLLLVGSTESFGSGMSDVYLIKTDFDGNSGCNEYGIVPSITNLQYNPYNVSVDKTFNATIADVSFSSQPIEGFVITQLCPAGIQAEFTSDVEVACVNETINFFDLSQYNPISWLWVFEGGNPPTSIEQHPQNIQYIVPGIYDVTLTVSDGSTQSTMVKEDFIHIMPLPDVHLGNDTTLCDGDTIMLCAHAGFQQYLWQDGSTDSCFLASSGGIYWVQVSDENGCIGMDTISLTLQPAPDVWLGNDTLVCSYEVLVLFPGSGFDSYLWQDGSAEPTYTVTESGLYWVEVANEFGCSGRDSINVTFLPEPAVWLGNDTTMCIGETLLLCPEQGFQQYLWQDGSTDSCFLASSGGIYWVQVTDENGCIGRDTINLTLLPGPEVWLGNDTLVCFNEMLMLNAGEGFESYLWQDGSGGQTFMVTEQGNYWVEVANECGSDADTINVSFTEPINFTLGNDTSFCYGQSIVLDPGSGFANYLWQNGATSQTLTAFNSGYYWVTVSDAPGCSFTDSIYIEVFQDFSFNLGNDTVTICDGDYIFLEGPDGFENYLWQDGSTFQSILADAEGLYWLEVTDENGCAARDSLQILVNSIPADLLGEDRVICPEETLTLQALPGYSIYIWHDGSANQDFLTSVPGEFWVTVQDEFGCTGSDTMVVLPFIAPDIGFSESQEICQGDSLLLNPGEGYISYLWHDGSQNPVFWAADEEFYKVLVETVCGFFADSVNIYFFQNHLDLGNDTVLCKGEHLLLYPGPGYSNHQWSTGSADSVLLVGEPGTYRLEAFDGNCYNSDEIRIDFYSDIRVPNVFTPNSDGYNDTFFVTTAFPDGILNFQMKIFNRWGREVHTLKNIHDEWDGKINGSDAAEGVYFWTCDYQTFDKSGEAFTRTQQGSVTILR